MKITSFNYIENLFWNILNAIMWPQLSLIHSLFIIQSRLPLFSRISIISLFIKTIIWYKASLLSIPMQRDLFSWMSRLEKKVRNYKKNKRMNLQIYTNYLMYLIWLLVKEHTLNDSSNLASGERNFLFKRNDNWGEVFLT